MRKVIVIGAGILGASTAYHLSKKDVELTVVDYHHTGQATDAAAGIICPWLSQRRNKAWYTLAKNGAAYYSSLIKQLAEDGQTETGYKQVGAINLQTDAVKLEKMIDRAKKKREDAAEIGDIHQLSTEETVAKFPLLSADFESVHITGAARVNGRALRQALVRAAEKNGAVFIKGLAELDCVGDQVTGVTVGEKQYIADTVLIASGVWAPQLLAPLGIDLKVKEQKAQIVHLEINNEDTNEWPVVMPPNDQYILTFDDGKIIVGATHEDDMSFDVRVTAGGLHEVIDKAIAVAPKLADATFVEARVGFRPVTPNFLPIIGEVPGIKGLLLANGLGASGLTVGPYLGAQLAKLAMGETLDIQLDLYKVDEAMTTFSKGDEENGN